MKKGNQLKRSIQEDVVIDEHQEEKNSQAAFGFEVESVFVKFLQTSMVKV